MRDIEPLPKVLEQIQRLYTCEQDKRDNLCFKGQQLCARQIDAIECVIKATVYDLIDFEYSFLDDEMANILGDILSYYDPTEKLNLSFNSKITYLGWSQIFKAINTCKTLTHLNLRYTKIHNPRSFVLLTNSLKSNPSLSCLHLENTNLSGRLLSDLTVSLSFNATLKELFLGENSLQASDGPSLFQLITRNNTLQLLELRNNFLNDQGLKHIADGLKWSGTVKNSSLCGLVLWNNQLTSASMECLANALIINGKIETLNVGKNNLIGDNGIIALKEVVKHGKCSLKRLGLQDTKLDDQSAILLAECLEDNKKIMRVDLRNNPKIGLAGLIALRLALMTNTSVTVLNLDKGCSKAPETNKKVQELQSQFDQYLLDIERYCDRNRSEVLKKNALFSDDESDIDEEIIETGDELEESKSNSIKSENQENQQPTEELKNNEISVVESSVLNKCEEVVELLKNDNLPPEQNICASMPQSLASIFSRLNDTEQLANGVRKRHNSSGGSSRNGRSNVKKRSVSKLVRSSSLTCEEHVSDIKERVSKMEDSLHDANRNGGNYNTIEKGNSQMTSIPSASNSGGSTGALSNNLSKSLPSLTQKPKVPVRRIRRFSVSPASSFISLAPATIPSEPTTPPAKEMSIVHQTKQKFMVQSVPNLSTLTEDCERKISLTELTRPNLVCAFDSLNNDDQQVVKCIVNDLINYCEYEAGDARKTPIGTPSTEYKSFLSGVYQPKILKNETESCLNADVEDILNALVNSVVEKERKEKIKQTARLRLLGKQ
uniref:Uncharacterized protein n=1 Tax=Rhabditophanes sp. KR3021 TaxID=114890 RepID=A0AC35UIG3_9BILA